jgi:hypothetical protein
MSDLALVIEIVVKKSLVGSIAFIFVDEFYA